MIFVLRYRRKGFKGSGIHSKVQSDGEKHGKSFRGSKSTVHHDVTAKLKYIDEYLYDEVKKLLQVNLSERHIRGGIATRRKYKY